MNMRTTGHGVAAGVGKLGAFVGVFLVPQLADHIGLRGLLYVAGGAAILGFVLTNVLPETSGRSLDEISDEGNPPTNSALQPYWQMLTTESQVDEVFRRFNTMIPKWYHCEMAFTIRTDPVLEEALNALARAEGISRQEIVRRLGDRALRALRSREPRRWSPRSAWSHDGVTFWSAYR